MLGGSVDMNRKRLSSEDMFEVFDEVVRLVSEYGNQLGHKTGESPDVEGTISFIRAGQYLLMGDQRKKLVYTIEHGASMAGYAITLSEDSTARDALLLDAEMHREIEEVMGQQRLF
jgi:hypothetical protein